MLIFSQSGDQHIFSVKSQIVNIFRCMGQTIFVATTQSYTQWYKTNRYGCVPITLYLQTQAAV